MSPKQRARFIDILIQDIGGLTGEFEQFGYRFMDSYHPVKWDHRGTTVSGAPAKSTVDSTGPGVAAEYTGEKNYFSDRKSTKLKQDIRHVVAKHASAKRAWMLSGCLATGGEMTRARGVAAKWKRIRVEVLDARRIAEYIVDNLRDHAFIERIAQYLPFLPHLRNEWALSHQIPTVEGYVRRPDDEDAVATALGTRRVVVVTGISGAGKSALCAQVAKALQAAGDYELVLWQDAGQLTDVQQLGAVYVDAHGERENLLGYLKLRRCLVVLDNVVVDDLPRQVMKESRGDTRVLATSQVTTHPDEFLELQPVDEKTARAILSTNLTSCPDDVFAAVYESVGGHPLLLSLLNNRVAGARGDWSVAASLAKTDAPLLPDMRRQRVCDRVLEQHRQLLSQELEFIAWCGAPLIDTAMLREVGGALGERALRQRHFVSADTYGCVRVNDLVFDSIERVCACSADRAASFTERLAAFVERALEDRQETLPLLRAARVHRVLVARLLSRSGLDDRTRAALRCTYALGRDSTIDLALLGDAVEDSNRLAGTTGGPGDTIGVRAVIETVEATFSIIKARENENAAVARHQTLLPAFTHLRSIVRLSPGLRQEVEFHEAKALLWCRDKSGAEAALRRLLAADPQLAAARVQLGRLLAERAKGASGVESEAAIQQFEAIVQQEPAVAVTVSLAAFELLRRVQPDRAIELLRQHRSRLLGDLRTAMAARLEQPFELLAGLGGLLWYHEGALLDDLFDVVSGRTAPATDDGAVFAWAQAKKQHAKSKIERGLSAEQARLLFREAVATYEQMRRVRDWERVQFAECLLLADEPSRALEVLDGVERDRSAHWFHRKAQAHLALGEAVAALAAIDASIGANSDEKYRATFLRERWRIRVAQQDADAIADLREAHRVCKPGKYQEQLGRELEAAETSPTPPVN